MTPNPLERAKDQLILDQARDFNKLWRSFLLVCLLNVVLLAAALAGWMR